MIVKHFKVRFSWRPNMIIHAIAQINPVLVLLKTDIRDVNCHSQVVLADGQESIRVQLHKTTEIVLFMGSGKYIIRDCNLATPNIIITITLLT